MSLEQALQQVTQNVLQPPAFQPLCDMRSRHRDVLVRMSHGKPRQGIRLEAWFLEEEDASGACRAGQQMLGALKNPIPPKM
jgi:hypothetical protein